LSSQNKLSGALLQIFLVEFPYANQTPFLIFLSNTINISIYFFRMLMKAVLLLSLAVVASSAVPLDPGESRSAVTMDPGESDSAVPLDPVSQVQQYLWIQVSHVQQCRWIQVSQVQQCR
jgi:hypothetical protein